jgi:phosphatidylserine decarboxylase
LHPEAFLITKYGYDVVLTVAGITIVGLIAALLGIQHPILKYSISGVLVVFLLFTLFFFRDPDRTIPDGDNIIVSPADGKLVLIKELEHADYLESPAIQMSIFLSPLNVHVNRIPWSGTVGYFRYIRGDFMVAYDHEASKKNERTEIGVERDGQKILFKQIVGSIARRIVCPLKEGDVVTKGERFGMIKFGSRMDIILPLDVTLKVEVGQKVVGGETMLAVLPD